MKLLRIFPFIVLAMLFASCEKVEDDRNRPVPNDPKTIWLLSVEVDELPSDVEAYSCAVFNVNNANDVNVFTRTESAASGSLFSGRILVSCGDEEPVYRLETVYFREEAAP